MKRVALRGLVARPVRTLLTMLAIVLGVAMVSGAFTLTDTMRGGADGLTSAAYGGTDAVVTTRTAFGVESTDFATRLRLVSASQTETFLSRYLVSQASASTIRVVVQNRFVLARPDLALHQRGQARLLASLVEALLAWLTDPDEADRLPSRIRDLVELAEAELPDGTPDRLSQARGRAVIDFGAALTDSQAVGLMDVLSGRSRQLWTDTFVR